MGTPNDAAPTIVGWGELLWDLFPAGRQLGGAPANLVYHAAQLGNRALLISRVGSDTLGDAAIQELETHGVDTRAIQRDDALPTGTVEVEINDDEPQYSIAQDVAWDVITIEDASRDALSLAAVFCFGTLAQRTAQGRATVLAAIDELPESCVRLCDLNLRPPFDDHEVVDAALRAATVVKMNDTEVNALAKLLRVTDPPSWMIKKRGIELVAVTRGVGGSVLYDRTGEHVHAGFAAGGDGDPVGAGDAFTAVMAHFLARDVPADQFIAAANRYAAHVASCAGAMPPIPEEVRTHIVTHAGHAS